jgi:hypothetical protein
LNILKPAGQKEIGISQQILGNIFYDDILVFILLRHFFHDIALSSAGRKDTDLKNGGKYPGDKNRFSCKAGIRAWLSRSPFRR